MASVIRQNGESQNELSRKQSAAKFSDKKYVYVSGGKICSTFRKFGVFRFLQRFTFLPYYQRYMFDGILNISPYKITILHKSMQIYFLFAFFLEKVFIVSSLDEKCFEMIFCF